MKDNLWIGVDQDAAWLWRGSNAIELRDDYGLAPGEKAKARLVVGECEVVRHSAYCYEVACLPDADYWLDRVHKFCPYCGRPIKMKKEPK